MELDVFTECEGSTGYSVVKYLSVSAGCSITFVWLTTVFGFGELVDHVDVTILNSGVSVVVEVKCTMTVEAGEVGGVMVEYSYATLVIVAVVVVGLSMCVGTTTVA